MKINVKISGMHCASCALNIEKSINKLGSGIKINVNFAGDNAIIEYNNEADLKKAYEIITSLGYHVMQEMSNEDHMHMHEDNIQKMQQSLIYTGILAIPLAVITMGPMLGLKLPDFLTNSYLQLILATFIVAFNRNFYINGFNSVVKAKSASMETLVALGTGAAYIYSVLNIFLKLSEESYFETAGLLLFFIALGEYFEAVAKRRSGDAIKKLLELQPSKAVVIRNGKEITIKIGEIKKGELIIIKPGQKLPVDGVIIDGYSSIDESMITGESLPIDKKKGDSVIGGTINKSGTFTFKAVKIGSETLLNQIVRMVGEAQASKAPIQRMADKISSIFVPSVLIAGLFSAIIWLVLGQSLYFATKIFITVLVISCPCALGLATPTAIMVGTGKGAENGILIKDAESLEKINKAKIIVFDKTGTLTKGEPIVNKVYSYAGFSEGDILRIAGSLEHNSEHPIAKAIIKKCKEEKIELFTVTHFENVPGMGIIALYKTQKLTLGNAALMQINNADTSIIDNDAMTAEHKGETIIYVAVDKKIAGLISVSDEIKSESKEAISVLKRAGYTIYMITGDNERSAKAVANNLGINHVLAHVLPDKKGEAIKRLQKEGSTVIMVGDGVNDAVALTQSDIGIALGSGTDVAIEAGNIVLVKSSVFDVVRALHLGEITFNKIRQNLFWAFFYNILCIPLAGGILYPSFGILLNPVIAGIAMSLSSVTVVTNSLLIRKARI
ncbi:putative copper-exporting P-type ATPase A [Candidatus Tiddalikarchaeum anstoanum]|nr:putative copper-exporting P-type ATPase A [Candidatus Tiddalikarchaeum anstoanum]